MLALALGGRTVAEWQSVMTHREFMEWTEFYRSWPFDDLHRYHRPAALISASFGGAGVADRIDWLSPGPQHDEHGRTSADRDLYAAAGIKLKG